MSIKIMDKVLRYYYMYHFFGYERNSTTVRILPLSKTSNKYHYDLSLVVEFSYNKYEDIMKIFNVYMDSDGETVCNIYYTLRYDELYIDTYQSNLIHRKGVKFNLKPSIDKILKSVIEELKSDGVFMNFHYAFYNMTKNDMVRIHDN